LTSATISLPVMVRGPRDDLRLYFLGLLGRLFVQSSFCELFASHPLAVKGVAPPEPVEGFEGPVLDSADRLADGFSLRYPDVRQTPIDRQADGSRAWDVVANSPMLDTFPRLGREAQLDFGAGGCVNPNKTLARGFAIAPIPGTHARFEGLLRVGV
jgi:hypothetical protein